MASFDRKALHSIPTDATEHVLLSPGTHNILRIAHQDTLLQLELDTRKLSSILEWAESFDEYVLTPLRTLTGLKHIVRYGIVYHFSNAQSAFRSLPSQRYLADDLPDARSLSLRFAKRLPVEEAIIKKRVDDYKNVIYSINESEDNSIAISLDYQIYFGPPLDAREWQARPFAKFAEKANDYLEGEFTTWLNRLTLDTKVA